MAIVAGLAGCADGGAEAAQSVPVLPQPGEPLAVSAQSGGYAMDAEGRYLQPADAWTGEVPVAPVLVDNTPENAVALAQFFLQATEYAWNTGDTGPMDAVFTEECVACGNHSARIRDTYANGGWAAGVVYSEPRIIQTLPHPDMPDRQVVVLAYEIAASRTSLAGEAPERYDAQLGISEFHICEQDGLRVSLLATKKESA